MMTDSYMTDYKSMYKYNEKMTDTKDIADIKDIRENLEITPETYRQILHTLSELGITANYSGFFYTAYTVMLALEDLERLQLVTKWLYPDTARRYKTSIDSIEKNIRTVCSLAWNRNPELLMKMAGYRLEKKPSCSEFLAIISIYFFYQLIL